MRLAIAILKYFPHGGLQKDFLRIAEEANKRGHTVTVYTTSWKGAVPEWITLRILNPFALTNHGKTVRFFRKLKDVLKKEPQDLVFGMNRGPGLDVYFAGDECFAAGQKRKHSSLYCRLSKRIRTFSEMERIIFAPGASTEILCLVEKQKKEFQQFYRTESERMYLIPPGMNPECIRPDHADQLRTEFRKDKNIAEDRLVLLCVGANLKLKGADRLMIAVNALPEVLRKNITLFLVGRKTKELEHMASQIPADIRFEGMQDKVQEYYLASDLMVHPARSEAAGSVLIEAIASGLPVICTELCGFSVFVRESAAGHVLHGEFHQEELNAALEALLSNKEHLLYLSREAQEYTGHTDFTGRAKTVVDILENRFYGIR